MKTIVLVFILGTAFATVNAQDARFGIRVGTNFSTVSAPENATLDDAVEYRNGYAIAFVSEIRFTDFYSFQPEAHLIQKGFQFDNNNELAFNYVEAHLMSRFNVGQKTVGGFFQIGPSLGIFSNGFQRVNGVRESISAGLFEDYNRFDLALVAGGGLSIDLGLNQLLFDLRYLHSITAVDDAASNDRIHNRGVVLSVGFTFGVGGGMELDE